MRNSTKRGLLMSVAITALDMIEADEELIKRLRDYATEQQGTPFKAGEVNSLILNVVGAELREVAMEALTGEDDEDEPAQQPQVGPRGLFIPIPRAEGAARESAYALGIASFTTEFVHAADGVLDQFIAWMDAVHPGKAGDPIDITRQQVEQADQTLTTMAHVADHIADREAGPSVGHDEKGRAPEEPTEIRYDDGTRHI